MAVFEDARTNPDLTHYATPHKFAIRRLRNA